MGEEETKDLQSLASSVNIEAAKDVPAFLSPAEEDAGDSQVPSALKDSALSRVRLKKKISLAKAWEVNEKTVIENRYQKELSSIVSWEKTKQADLDADLKKYEEIIEKKKAEYEEKIKNKVAQIHKSAEEKRAAVEAIKGQALLKAEEQAEKYREKSFAPQTALSVCNCCLLRK